MENNANNNGAVKKSLQEIVDIFGEKESIYATFFKPEDFKRGVNKRGELWISATAIGYDKGSKERVFINNVNFNGKVAEEFEKAIKDGNRLFELVTKFGEIKPNSGGFDDMPVFVNEIKGYQRDISLKGEIVKAEKKEKSQRLTLKTIDDDGKGMLTTVVVKDDKFSALDLNVGKKMEVSGNLSTRIKENGFREETLWPEILKIIEKQKQGQKVS